ncbi:hypothetical protein RF11_08165 [Thelohanellus kitauei]|uniref:Uncharacterized protein n=1 Tax=Thelohanellus kitauei TaxID=669202 RepID=A0A0C2N9G6_THEKT|nr:hypothetical protein RF11_08165 [Thelohanellus kitauei]
MNTEERNPIPDFNVNDTSNQEALTEYIIQTKSRNMSVQREDVKEFIRRFSQQNFSYADHLFISHFPKELYQQFEAMSNGRSELQRFVENLDFIIEIFCFIFRNNNVLKYAKAHNFIVFFLSCIKNCTTSNQFVIENILDSINFCILYEKNRLFFIHENGMYHLYSFFQRPRLDLALRFLKKCKQVYIWHREKIASLSPMKLTVSVYRILSDHSETRCDETGKLLLLVLKMISQLRFLDDIQFSLHQLIKLTINMLYIYKRDRNDDILSFGISKIWSGIINSPKNTFQFFRKDKFECLGSVFAIDLSRKFRTAVGRYRKFEVTKKIRQKLIIINLTLVYVNKIGKNPSVRFRRAFKELHRGFKEYLQIHALEDQTIEDQTIEDQTIEDQFILLQYYIKSHFSLNVKISPPEERVVYRYLERFASWPLLKLHALFLDCQLFHVSLFNVTSLQSNFSDYSEKIKGLIHGLILALTDETYISKLQNEQKLFLYEDVKSVHLSKINSKCIKQVFISVLNEFGYHTYSQPIRNYPNSEFHIYKHVFARIILSFYHSNYLDQKAADCYLRLIEDPSTISSQISLNSDIFENWYNYAAATNAIYLNNLSFPMLLRLFV